MSWESRGKGGRFYYRVYRIGGRLVHQYVGSGLVALLAAAQDSRVRADREARRRQAREERSQLESAEAAARELGEEADLVLRAALLATGYHRHGGEWRRKRHDCEEA
jgi:hypothetical protein